MKKIIKVLSVVISVCILSLPSAGCSGDTETIQGVQSSDITAETVEASGNADNKSAAESDASNASDILHENGEGNFVYIGTAQSGFKEYPVKIEGELSAEKLIFAIAGLTGWNLSLSDEVFSGKGGMTVSFSKDCSLVTGPPENQKDEFRVYDNYGLARLILDSVQETLRKNFAASPGNPENLDIWYSIEDNPIEIEGMTVSMELPWDEQSIF